MTPITVFKTSFNDRKSQILAWTVTLSTFWAATLSYLCFPAQFEITRWAVVYGMFLAFFRMGRDRKQQAWRTIRSALLSLIVVSIGLILTLYPLFHMHLILAGFILFLLLLPRWVSGGQSPSVFYIIYLLIGQMLHPHLTTNTLQTALQTNAIGLGFGLLFTVIMIFALPCSAIDIPDPDKSFATVKRAVRLSISLSAAFIIAYFARIQHVSWICFSVIVISQVNLGSTLRKASHRLYGTIAGALLGYVLAHALFSQHIAFLYLDYIILYLMFLAYYTNYAYTMCFATTLVVSTYYILTPIGITVDQYILARVFDTLLGISIGLLGEILIFPSSMLTTLRLHIKANLRDIFTLLNLANQEKVNHEEIEQLQESIRLSLQALDTEFGDFKNEPLALLTRRYAYFKLLNQHINKLFAMIKLNLARYPQNLTALQLKYLQKIIDSIIAITPNTAPSALNPCLSELKQLEKSVLLKQGDKLPILYELEKLVDLYQQVLSVSRYRLRWR